MKTFVYCAVCIVATYSVMAIWENCFSDENEIQRIAEAGKVLNPPYGAGPLVSIVWYKGSGQLPHKIFATSRDIKNIHHRLEYKTSTSIAKNKAFDLSQEDMLSFVYYSSKKDDYRMRYIPFKIEDGVFYWPYGEDKRLAQILMNKEKWEESFLHIDPSGIKYLGNKKTIREKLGIAEKSKVISQVEKALPERAEMDEHEIELSDTCDLARGNLMALVSFSMQAEAINSILSELNEGELYESLIHAFVELPKHTIKDYGKSIKPEYIRRIEHFNKKYAEEGLDRKEQVELFQVHQNINKQILDELQSRQNDFERILKTNESSGTYME